MGILSALLGSRLSRLLLRLQSLLFVSNHHQPAKKRVCLETSSNRWESVSCIQICVSLPPSQSIHPRWQMRSNASEADKKGRKRISEPMERWAFLGSSNWAHTNVSFGAFWNSLLWIILWNRFENRLAVHLCKTCCLGVGFLSYFMDKVQPKLKFEYIALRNLRVLRIFPGSCAFHTHGPRIFRKKYTPPFKFWRAIRPPWNSPVNQIHIV